MVLSRTLIVLYTYTLAHSASGGYVLSTMGTPGACVLTPGSRVRCCVGEATSGCFCVLATSANSLCPRCLLDSCVYTRPAGVAGAKSPVEGKTLPYCCTVVVSGEYQLVILPTLRYNRSTNIVCSLHQTVFQPIDIQYTQQSVSVSNITLRRSARLTVSSTLDYTSSARIRDDRRKSKHSARAIHHAVRNAQ